MKRENYFVLHIKNQFITEFKFFLLLLCYAFYYVLNCYRNQHDTFKIDPNCRKALLSKISIFKFLIVNNTRILILPCYINLIMTIIMSMKQQPSGLTKESPQLLNYLQYFVEQSKFIKITKFKLSANFSS